MKITRISIWHVPLTSHLAYYMADGKACKTVETVVVRLDTDQGPAGFGEVCPIPHGLRPRRSPCDPGDGAACPGRRSHRPGSLDDAP